MKTTHLSLIFTGVLAAAAITACGDKDDDTGGTGDDGATDTGDTTDDGGTDSGETSFVTYFEPTGVAFEMRHGLVEGAMADVTSGGSVIEPYFAIRMTDDDWSGDPAETRHHCTMFYDVSSAELSSCTNDDGDACWAAFELTKPVSLGWGGECDNLDPDSWAPDVSDPDDGDAVAESVVAQFGASTMGWGFAPMSSEFGTEVETAYADYWADYGTKFMSNMLYTDLTGEPTWFELNTAFVYEIDETGELTVEGKGNVLLDIDSGAAVAPDGFYSGSPFYGFVFN